MTNSCDLTAEQAIQGSLNSWILYCGAPDILPGKFKRTKEQQREYNRRKNGKRK